MSLVRCLPGAAKNHVGANNAQEQSTEEVGGVEKDGGMQKKERRPRPGFSTGTWEEMKGRTRWPEEREREDRNGIANESMQEEKEMGEMER